MRISLMNKTFSAQEDHNIPNGSVQDFMLMPLETRLQEYKEWLINPQAIQYKLICFENIRSSKTSEPDEFSSRSRKMISQGKQIQNFAQKVQTGIAATPLNCLFPLLPQRSREDTEPVQVM